AWSATIEEKVSSADVPTSRFKILTGVKPSMSVFEAMGAKDDNRVDHDHAPEGVRIILTMLGDDIDGVPEKDIAKAFKDAELPKRTLRRVRDAIGIVFHREGFGKGSVMRLTLPTDHTVMISGLEKLLGCVIDPDNVVGSALQHLGLRGSIDAFAASAS